MDQFKKLMSEIGKDLWAMPGMTSWESGFLEKTKLKTETSESLAKILRIKWLERAFDNKYQTERLQNVIVPCLQANYPASANLFDLLPGAFARPAKDYFTVTRYQQARKLLQTGDWPVEVVLFLSNYFQSKGFSTRRQCFLLREASGLSGPFATVELIYSHHEISLHLRKLTLKEGDGSLGVFDSAAAAELAFYHSTRAYELSQTLGQTLEPIVGSVVAKTVVDDIAKTSKEQNSLIRRDICFAAVRAGPDFALVARSQFNPGVTRQTVIDRMRWSVVDDRCRLSKKPIDAIDREAEVTRLLGFDDHLKQLSNGYDGYLPLSELDAELEVINGNSVAAVTRFEELFRKRPQSAYYAYRTGLAMRAAGIADAHRYLIHASRQSATRWRDEVAVSRAMVAAYEYEGAALRNVPPRIRAECANKLADRLQEAWKRTGPPRQDLDTAARLAVRIAQLRHYALEQSPPDVQRVLADGVIGAYARVDEDGHARLRERAPEAVFDPIIY